MWKVYRKAYDGQNRRQTNGDQNDSLALSAQKKKVSTHSKYDLIGVLPEEKYTDSKTYSRYDYYSRRKT